MSHYPWELSWHLPMWVR
uniref:Uncharacterized protein n=1 Tax=Phlebotomus papatasi TaxID=29031 RepID=A0A1B0D6C2_PHLPP